MPVFRHLLYVPAFALLHVVVSNAREAARAMLAASELKSFAGASEQAWKQALETLSLSLYRGASDVAEAHARLLAQAARSDAAALQAAWLVGALALAQVLLLASPPPAPARAWAWHAWLASACAYAVGISAPLMTLAAYAEVPVLGQVVLDYDSKSVLDALGALLRAGDWLLAGLLGLFSVAVPLLKFAATGIALASFGGAWRTRTVACMRRIGRWSLTDVFVVAVLVAFLVGDKGAGSATVGIGLYFFLAYCVLGQYALSWVERPTEMAGDA